MNTSGRQEDLTPRAEAGGLEDKITSARSRLLCDQLSPHQTFVSGHIDQGQEVQLPRKGKQGGVILDQEQEGELVTVA